MTASGTVPMMITRTYMDITVLKRALTPKINMCMPIHTYIVI
ncbi:hypothetical protein DSM106044_04683 [Robinsoniella peoriensis]|uniref:Uncharacterized protein n=1 Tax=Robinsoniella peoriensis TaxID=180332 RepID=A0A4U8Q2Z9_9FIRM|nr:hypothetical protein DSM106044_04683 [Robinsoniella peoriensis]